MYANWIKLSATFNFLALAFFIRCLLFLLSRLFTDREDITVRISRNVHSITFTALRVIQFLAPSDQKINI